MFDDHKHPHFCPHCHTLNDMASCVWDRGRPKPGDWTICLRCVGVSRFTKDLRLRALAHGELERAPQPIRGALGHFAGQHS